MTYSLGPRLGNVDGTGGAIVGQPAPDDERGRERRGGGAEEPDPDRVGEGDAGGFRERLAGASGEARRDSLSLANRTLSGGLGVGGQRG